jgi:hypothetical protein
MEGRKLAPGEGDASMIDIESISPKAHKILVYGEISGEDVKKLIAFVKSQNEAQAGGNVLFDLVSMAGYAFGAVAGELVHAPAMMQWITRLGRIAVVSDEGWIRTAARLESALLPGVTYSVYDADEAEAAEAWVLEDSNRPHAGAFRARDSEPGIAVFELVGRLDRTESEHAMSAVREKMADPACRRLMLVIRKWHGFDPDAAINGEVLQGKFALIDEIARYAVVGGPDWLRQMAAIFGALVKPKVKTFALADENAALAWLRE